MSSNTAEETRVDQQAIEAQIAELNDRYRALSPEQRVKQLYSDFAEDEVMLTSSFATNSAFLLHLFSQTAPHQKVIFIDTGYHFQETLLYKEELIELYNLKVEDVRAEEWKYEFTLKDQTWKTDQDLCCSINKVEPLQEVKQNYKVWVSGLMRWQTEHRAGLDVFEFRGGMIKFYPLIDVTKQQREEYIREHQLPFHPMVAKGFSSVGCTHCTRPGDDRSGRWVDTPKSECGLHL